VCAWYPITPFLLLAEAFQKYCSKLRDDKEPAKNKFAIVRARRARLGRLAAGGVERRARLYRDPGPGISLMQEFIGLPIAEIR